MKTTPRILVALGLAAALCAATTVSCASARPLHRSSVRISSTGGDLRSLGHPAAVAPTYGWPLKPFDRQHPVRAFLDDPRIGRHGGRAFHFGIDIAGLDGTPVYAVTGGILYLAHGSLSVVSGARHEFGYWHIVRNPQLREHQLVHRHQLLGTIAPNWGHVHFAERIGKAYVNPLRPGGIGPYTDPVPPSVDGVSAVVHADGTISLVAGAHDTTWPPVPGTWKGEPVTPALLRWRVSRADGTPGTWRTAADFRARMLDRRRFGSIYAPDTAQNHESRPGTYAFFLAHRWHPAAGSYRVEVVATDTRGNTAVDSVVVRVG